MLTPASGTVLHVQPECAKDRFGGVPKSSTVSVVGGIWNKIDHQKG
jgi:hypothetical protein